MNSSYENTKKRSLPPDFLCKDRVVSYIHDEDLIKETEKVPKIGHRVSITCNKMLHSPFRAAYVASIKIGQ